MSSLLKLIHSNSNLVMIHKNSHKSFLIEKTIQRNEGKLGPEGELIVLTGDHTGRAADDKYIVKNEITEKTIWWENNIRELSEENFKKLQNEAIEYLQKENELFYTERSIGNSNHYSLGVEFISTQPSAAFFTEYMFKKYEGSAHNDIFKIIHVPNLKIDPKKYNARSETMIVTCFKEKTTIIVGTFYAGEIKKSMFSIMNFIVPDVGILPMHSGANQHSNGESFVFFGLSGTGKTTLATDEGTCLIGDDEHGLSEKGLFNFEGGCYAKTLKLSSDTEPAIFSASTRYSSFLENVKLKDDRSSIDFFDDSLTENGRSSYPLEFITDRVKSGEGKMPKQIFFLSADAFGVLPPVSLINSQQAMDYFILGYTAKLAGTEVGLKAPKATFSPCFGAPFMLRHPSVYATLLSRFIEKHNIKIWLINTGWYGGGYGVGKRFPLKITREIIRAIQNEELEKVDFTPEPFFGLKIPNSVRTIESSVLNPIKSWKNEEAYAETAKKLAESFKQQLKKI